MAPRTPTQNQALRESTRIRILEGALRVFGRHGYGGSSIRQIAKEAGVAQGLLYSHFPGKAELLRAIFERSMEDVRLSFAAAAAPGSGSSLEHLIRSAFAILRGNLEFWRLSYSVRMQESVIRTLGPELQAWTGEILGTLERFFRAEGTAGPALEAAVLFAAIDGIGQHYALDPAHYPLDPVTETLVARYRPKSRKAAAAAKSEQAGSGKIRAPKTEKAGQYVRKKSARR